MPAASDRIAGTSAAPQASVWVGWPGLQPAPVTRVGNRRTLLRLQREYWKAQQQARRGALLAELAVVPAGRTPVIGDSAVLAAELADSGDIHRTVGSAVNIAWQYPVWALNPDDGTWYLTRHTFSRPVKQRRRGQQCGVCAGYDVDATTSAATWMPALFDSYADERIAFAELPVGLHNAGPTRPDLADDKGYATLRWMCRWHGEFFATMQNRTAEATGGTGCPRCGPSGLSKEQLRLACELRYLFPGTEVDPKPLPVPAHLRGDWGLRQVSPDIVIVERRVIVEYDGMYGHALREIDEPGTGSSKEQRQTAVLHRLGYDVLRVGIHSANQAAATEDVRVGPRRELRLAMPQRSSPHEVAAAVAQRIQDWTGPVPGLDRYVELGAAASADEADALITHLWSTPARRRVRRRSAPASRIVPIPIGTRSGHLVVLSPRRVAASSSAQDAHLVSVRCDCGTERTVAATELRRKRDPREHCGPRCPLIPRPTYQAPTVGNATVRAWAVENDIPVGASGRIPGRVLRAYQQAHPDGVALRPVVADQVRP